MGITFIRILLCLSAFHLQTSKILESRPNQLEWAESKVKIPALQMQMVQWFIQNVQNNGLAIDQRTSKYNFFK